MKKVLNDGMVFRSYSKLEVATQQLDTALRLYFQKKDYFSAITLAGAAEEILGVYLKVHKQPNAFNQALDSSLMVYRWLNESEGSRDIMHNVINRVKNSSKHMKGSNDITLQCNPKEELRALLDRAVSNYYALMDFEELDETPRIRKFNFHLIGRSEQKGKKWLCFFMHITNSNSQHQDFSKLFSCR